jgi:hypothetical protein
VDPCQPLILGQRWAGAGCSVLDGDLGVEPRHLGNDEEGADRRPRGRAGREPLVDVGLGAGGCGPLIGLVEPDEELDGLGDLLLGRVHRPVCCRAGGRLGPNAAQVMPGGEMLDGLADLVGQPVQLRRDPVLEPCQVWVARWQESVG